MTRQEALRILWKRLLGLLVVILTLCMAVFYLGAGARTGILVFLIGNVGGYVGMHRSLVELKDDEVVELAKSWWSIVVSSFVGGVLALVLYLIFLSGILAGDLFPRFITDEYAPKGVESIFSAHATDMPAYAKLFFWSFIGGFNQKYVVDIIDSIKAK